MKNFPSDISALFARLGERQLMLVLVAMCLALVVLLLVCLLILQRRTRQAEKKLGEVSGSVAEQLSTSGELAKEERQQTRKELDDAMQTMNDAMVRLLGEITRIQQGQLDSLSGQMRAAGKQEEEHMERLLETVDRRLNAYEDRLGDVGKTLDDKLIAGGNRIECMRETLEDGLRRMNKDNKEQLEQIRLTVDEKLSTTVDQRLEASFAAVAKRLEQVSGSISAMQSLAGSVDELRRTLGGAQPLGSWGEVQLGALLSQMLAPEQYAQHASVRPGGEPVADYAVVMPGQSEHTVILPIDASLPMREYSELREALEHGSRQEEDDARALLESCVRMHARRMSEKLIAPPYTTDYAVLFLQSEGLFCEVLRIGGLAERIQKESRLVIAGPTTLAALLSSLQMGFRSLAIEQRTREIAELLAAVRTDLGGFAGLLSRTQKQLRQATESIESAQRHSASIAQRLSNVGELSDRKARELLGDAEIFEEEDEWD